MRIRGRRLYPSTLSERRVLMSLGGTPLYAPRGVSPYLLARRIVRCAKGEPNNLAFVSSVLGQREMRQGDQSTDAALCLSPAGLDAPSDQDTVAA